MTSDWLIAITIKLAQSDYMIQLSGEHCTVKVQLILHNKRAEVNVINILLAAFKLVGPKSAKQHC